MVHFTKLKFYLLRHVTFNLTFNKFICLLKFNQYSYLIPLFLCNVLGGEDQQFFMIWSITFKKFQHLTKWYDDLSFSWDSADWASVHIVWFLKIQFINVTFKTTFWCWMYCLLVLTTYEEYAIFIFNRISKLVGAGRPSGYGLNLTFLRS